MNNKYPVACITLVRDKYTVRLHGAPCSLLDGVTACVVYTADSIRKFDSKSNRTAHSIRDSIRTQVPSTNPPSVRAPCSVIVAVCCFNRHLFLVVIK